MTSPLAARHEVSSTLHSDAAAEISIIRAAAPASRSGCHDSADGG